MLGVKNSIESENNMDMLDKNYSIGIDIGGTKCAVVLGKGVLNFNSKEGFIIEKTTFLTKEAGSWEDVVQKLIVAIAEIWNKYDMKASEVVGIGISCGGPLDHKRGIIMNPPNLSGWNNVPIVDLIKEKFSVPVYLENDANACAVAEWRFGVARGKKNVIFLTFGTGMGAGLILDNKLYHGTNNMAGEIGHVRLSRLGPVGYGKAGSFEGFCSGGGIVQIAQNRLLEELQQGRQKEVDYWRVQKEITTESLAIAAKQGDLFALSVFDVSAEYLGKGLSILIDILNPEIIIVGSVYERCRDLFYDRMHEVLKKESLANSYGVCEITAASLGDEVGDYAALAVAFG